MPPAENPQPTESNLPGAPQALNADGTNEDPDWNKVPKPEFNEWRNVQWWANDHYIATSNKVRKVTIIVNNQEIELVGTPYPGPSWTTKYTVPEGTKLEVGKIYEVKYYMSGNLVNKDYLPKLQK